MPQISEEQAQALKLFQDQRIHVVNTRDPSGDNSKRLIGLIVPANMGGGNGMTDLMFMFEKALGIHPSQKD
jgi:hypothetical protein